MKITLKPIVLLLTIATALSIISCGGNTNNTIDYQNVSENNDAPKDANTFYFTDGGGCSYTLTVDGEKIVLSGNGNTYYGSSMILGGAKRISFSEVLWLTPNNTITTSPTAKPFKPHMKDGALYFSYTAAKAEDPNNCFALRN